MAIGTDEKPWDKRGEGHVGPYDTIVIGSGMGGLTTAAMLAKAGEKVLILEQHYVPGGFTHVFNRPGYVWDVGVHAVGEVTPKSFLGRLLQYLTDGRLKWASLGPVYDEFFWPDGVRVDFPDNPKQFRDNLVAAFPGEATAIDAYLKRVRDVSRAVGPYFLLKTLPGKLGDFAGRFAARKAQQAFQELTQDALDALTSNKKLQAVLASQWGYYGSIPRRSSFAIQALVTKHFQWGAWYPEGGSQEIARHLLKTVAAAGGWTRVSTDVEEILVENGKAVGVRIRKTGEIIRAQRIVSAAGVQSTVNRLLPPSQRQTEWAESVSNLESGPAHVCLYLGFKGDIRQAGASAANKWFYETWSMDADAWQVKAGQEAPDAPILYCSFPSLKDPLHDPGPEQRHTGEVVTFVPWDEFESWAGTRWKKRGDDYAAFKAALTERMLKQFFSHMPHLEPLLDFAELSTPLSTENFTRPVRGSIYGLEPTPKRFANPWLKARSPIPGLFFSGSEVGTVGVMGAMLGGALAAVAARPLPMLKMVAKLRK